MSHKGSIHPKTETEFVFTKTTMQLLLDLIEKNVDPKMQKI